MIDRFFRPLFGGLTLDPALGVSSRFFYVILKSLLGGDSAVPAEGMDAIPRQLAQRFPKGVVRLDSKVDAIDGTRSEL
ncbi:MAG TPA: FAD-dependent oxidoreductase [Actinomycetota bacterium]|nr:FAD-dependent oxidoreductase [Actinomycetota bacterium]